MFAIKFLSNVLETLILPILLLLAIGLCFEKAIEKPTKACEPTRVESQAIAPAAPAPAKHKLFGLVPPPPPLEVLLGG